MSKPTRARTIGGLKRIRAQMDAEMPRKTRDDTIVLGTWNIRNFDDNRFGSGPRSDEDIYYLAEILARFDVIAVQEICDDLKPLKRLMNILGGVYDYVISDVTEGAGGNGERLAFIFDRNKVRFTGIAGELVLPDKMKIDVKGKRSQFARTPFMCSFQSGWFKFMFSTVHIYFGAPSGAKYDRRVKEINQVASFLAKRAKVSDHNHILVGDFNIKEKGSKGHNALTRRGFETFQNKLGSNKDQTKHYDQISYWPRENELKISGHNKCQGVLQFFDSLYREQDYKSHKPEIKKTINAKITRLEQDIVDATAHIVKTKSAKVKKDEKDNIIKYKASIKTYKKWLSPAGDADLKNFYLSEWRTFRGSDHLPLWVELKIDFSEPYLDKMLAYERTV